MIMLRILILVALWAAAFLYPLHGALIADEGDDLVQIDATDPSSVLVLYPDTGEGAEYGALHAVNVANLVGRHAEAALMGISEYEADDRDAHDALVVVNTAWEPELPAALIEDVVASEETTIWIEGGPDDLQSSAPVASPVANSFAQAGWLAEQVTGEDFNEVLYAGERFPRNPDSTDTMAAIEVTDPTRVDVLAEMRTSTGETRPWAIRSGALTYVAESPMAYAGTDDRYLVFTDILSRALAPQVDGGHYALLRIEDIGPEADPEQLRVMAHYMEQATLPFSATVYDTYRDPQGVYNNGVGESFTLQDRPHVSRALRDMVRAGGTLIMHGHTHQLDQQMNPFGPSGQDYEFFKASLDGQGKFVLDAPVEDDTLYRWRRTMNAGLEGWEAADLPRPFIFTFPHYAGSLSAYQAISEFMPVRFERVLYFGGEAEGQGDSHGIYGEQFFPYPVRDIRGDIILPETLGNFAPDGSVHGRSVDEMLATARRNLVLREAYAGFFYHWYLDTPELDQLVTGLREMGYDFISPEGAATTVATVVPEPDSGFYRMAASYRATIASPDFWLQDRTEWIILLLIVLAHLVIFRIGPRKSGTQSTGDAQRDDD